MSTHAFPLLTLHPLADKAHRWCALMIQAEPGRAMDTPALASLFGELGLFDSLGGLPCVLPVFLPAVPAAALAELLPCEQAVLRVSSAYCVDPANADIINEWQIARFRVMADGLPATGDRLPPGVLLAVDWSAETDPDRAATWARLPGVHLACHVDQAATRTAALAAGFAWIGGNYPLCAAGGPLAAGNPGRTVMMKLLAQIASDADAADIEKTLKQDPNLSYQLLKLVNSVAFSLTTKISSFAQAIALLGRRQLQRWLQLLLYAHPAGPSGEASPLMPRAAWRAGLMEGLARAAGESREMQEHAFMVGMFSLLDILVGQPEAEVIKPLNLSEDVTTALVAHQGPLGAWLQLVEAAESGTGTAVREALAVAGVDTRVWAAEQSRAVQWAIQVSREA